MFGKSKASPEKFAPSVKIVIKEKEYELIATFKALSKIENALGMGIFALINGKLIDGKSYGMGLTVEEMKTIIMSAATTEPNERDVEEHIMQNHVLAISQISNFLVASFAPRGEPQDAEEDKKK